MQHGGTVNLMRAITSSFLSSSSNSHNGDLEFDVGAHLLKHPQNGDELRTSPKSQCEPVQFQREYRPDHSRSRRHVLRELFPR